MAVLALAFLAVGREGVETALFMVGYAEAQTAWPLIGLVIGVLIAAAIAYGMYAGAIRINLAKFFKYTGVFLIVVAAGILSYGVGALQTVGWLPGLSRKAFDITTWFNWSSWYGEVIQGIFNVTPTPTVLQFSLWLAYLVIVLAIFLRPTKAPCENRSLTTTSTRTRKVNHVKLHSTLAIATAALAGLALTSCQAKEAGKDPLDARPERTCGDHRHRVRHRVRAVGHRRRNRCQTLS